MDLSDLEVVIVGNNIPEDIPKVDIIVNDNDFIEFLGKRKNLGTEASSGEVIVHCDDDIIFPIDWYRKFKEYNNENPDWQFLGNRVLLPDGGRYWDRSIFLPYHKMVDYDFYSSDVTFYQSGAFSVSKRSLLDRIKWSDEIPFYGTLKGFKYNEDVEFSLKLKEEGVRIYFDKNNTVWHNDFNYESDDIICIKRKSEASINKKCLEFILCEG
jgi:GT2 family glycosyltransferase